MKTIIQQTAVPLYWSVQGHWTHDPAEALGFLDEVRARDYAFLHEIDLGATAILVEKRERRRATQRRMQPCKGRDTKD